MAEFGYDGSVLEMSVCMSVCVSICVSSMMVTRPARYSSIGSR